MSSRLRWLRLYSASQTLRRSAFGFPRVLENSSVEWIEAVGCCKEPETGFVSYNDACGFRADFDNIGIRHAYDFRVRLLGFLTRTNSEGLKKFQINPSSLRVISRCYMHVAGQVFSSHSRLK